MPAALPVITVWVGNTLYFVSTAVIAQSALIAYGVYKGMDASRKARMAAESNRRDLQVVLQTAVEPHRTVYGRAKVSGPLVYVFSAGPDHVFMQRVVALTGHEIDAYEQVFFNDESLTTVPALPWTTPTFSVVTSARYVRVGIPPDYSANVEGYLGTTTQTASADLITQSGGQWTTDHRLRGRAYLSVRNVYAADIYTEGLPNIAAVIRGKKLYDPRDLSTVWSRNPALVIRDYLVNVLNVDAARIDDASFSAAANVCDEYVSLDTSAQGDPTQWAAYMTAAVSHGTWELVSGTTYRQRRYTIDGVVTADTNPGDVLEQMVFACAGYLSYTGGVWRLIAGAYTAPTLTLTEADLRGSPQFQPKPPRRELANVARGSFVGPMNQYQATDFPPLKATALIADDGGIEMPMDLDLPFVNDGAACQRLASIFLYRSRQGVLRFPATLTGLALRPGDTVAVTLPRFGFSAEVYRVEGWSLSDDLGVDLVLREEAAAIYTWTPTTTITDPSPQLSLPNPWSVPDVTGLAATSGVGTALVQNDGSIQPRSLVSWDVTTNAFQSKVEIETRITGQTAWTTHPAVNDVDGQVYILGLLTNFEHEIRARRRNTIGSVGAWTTISHTPLPVNAVANLLLNSNWEDALGYPYAWYTDARALRYWFSDSTSANPQYVRNYENGTAWNIGHGGMAMYDPPNVDGSVLMIYQDVSVVAGQTYEASVYVGAARCQAWIGIEYLNAAKSTILATATDFVNAGTGQVGDPYAPFSNPRAWCKLLAPATAAYARVSLRMQKTAGTSPYPFSAWNNALFCIAPTGVTRETATPWLSAEYKSPTIKLTASANDYTAVPNVGTVFGYKSDTYTLLCSASVTLDRAAEYELTASTVFVWAVSDNAGKTNGTAQRAFQLNTDINDLSATETNVLVITEAPGTAQTQCVHTSRGTLAAGTHVFKLWAGRPPQFPTTRTLSVNTTRLNVVITPT